MTTLMTRTIPQQPMAKVPELSDGDIRHYRAFCPQACGYVVECQWVGHDTYLSGDRRSGDYSLEGGYEGCNPEVADTLAYGTLAEAQDVARLYLETHQSQCDGAADSDSVIPAEYQHIISEEELMTITALAHDAAGLPLPTERLAAVYGEENAAKAEAVSYCARHGVGLDGEPIWTGGGSLDGHDIHQPDSDPEYLICLQCGADLRGSRSHGYYCGSLARDDLAAISGRTLGEEIPDWELAAVHGSISQQDGTVIRWSHLLSVLPAGADFSSVEAMSAFCTEKAEALAAMFRGSYCNVLITHPRCVGMCLTGTSSHRSPDIDREEVRA